MYMILEYLIESSQAGQANFTVNEVKFAFNKYYSKILTNLDLVFLFNSLELTREGLVSIDDLKKLCLTYS